MLLSKIKNDISPYFQSYYDEFSSCMADSSARPASPSELHVNVGVHDI